MPPAEKLGTMLVDKYDMVDHPISLLCDVMPGICKLPEVILHSTSCLTNTFDRSTIMLPTEHVIPG